MKKRLEIVIVKNVDTRRMKKTGHRISAVEDGSIAWEMGVEPGMFLLSVNGQEVEDIFDYRFLISDTQLEVLIREENGEETLLQIEKDEEEDLGLSFDSPLMSEYRSCSNRCIFCFIDQMPPGMRETLYFKDDDSRLSFLQGNYVTLTNMSEHDIKRIIRYRMEPINISVHTTNPELRVRMLRNRFAGDALKKIRVLKEAGIAMNGQIVLCKGWNDGDELDRTIRDLTAYLPQMQSVSVVPVGLSRWREGLTELEPFTPEDAREVIDRIESWQARIMKELTASYVPEEGEEEPDLMRGAPRHFIHASDEWYLLAGRDLPEAARYDGYIQYENGVGMLRMLIDETQDAIEKRREEAACGLIRVPDGRTVVGVSGTLAAPYLEKLAEQAMEAFPGIRIHTVPVRNDFFGERITVTGLLTGQDILNQLRAGMADGSLPKGDEILIPATTLRRGEHVFLDDRTTEELEALLGIPVRITDDSGDDLVRAWLGLPRAEEKERQYYE